MDGKAAPQRWGDHSRHDDDGRKTLWSTIHICEIHFVFRNEAATLFFKSVAVILSSRGMGSIKEKGTDLPIHDAFSGFNMSFFIFKKFFSRRKYVFSAISVIQMIFRKILGYNFF